LEIISPRPKAKGGLQPTMKTTQQDLKIIEPVPERSNWRGSESSTLENDVYIWCYALI